MRSLDTECPLISRLRGVLLSHDLTMVEIETGGGVVYEVEVPLKVGERLPPVGESLELRTVQVTREDSVSLYGFLEVHERELFKRLLTASGVGAKLAVAMLSAFSAGRLAQALAEKDLVALTQVSGVGKKKAERIALELSEKVGDLAATPDGRTGVPPGAEGAVKALVSLGYGITAAHAAVRAALKKDVDLSTEELIREALSSQ
jgi:Holliday junction DNA helicase RuvA